MIVNFSRRFRKESEYFGRTYTNFDDDLAKFISNLKSGIINPDRIKGLRIPIFKVRMKNSSTNSGKSGGFRIIYYLVTKNDILLLSIYSKTQKQDISRKEILHILKKENLV